MGPAPPPPRCSRHGVPRGTRRAPARSSRASGPGRPAATCAAPEGWCVRSRPRACRVQTVTNPAPCGVPRYATYGPPLGKGEWTNGLGREDERWAFRIDLWRGGLLQRTRSARAKDSTRFVRVVTRTRQVLFGQMKYPTPIQSFAWIRKTEKKC